MSPVPMLTPTAWGGGLSLLHPWPPANGLTTINCPRNASVFTVSASTHIYAPANIIWHTLRNTTAFPEWNTFTPSAAITEQPLSDQLPAVEQDFLNLGAKFTFQVVVNASAPSALTTSMEKVSDVSTPQHLSSYIPEDILKNDGSFYPDLENLYRIAWITDPDSDIVKLGLSAERFNEIIPLDHCEGTKKGCEYRTWESQCGAPAEFVKEMYQGLLQEDFVIWARDLKGESERKVKLHEHGGGGECKDHHCKGQ